MSEIRQYLISFKDYNFIGPLILHEYEYDGEFVHTNQRYFLCNNSPKYELFCQNLLSRHMLYKKSKAKIVLSGSCACLLSLLQIVQSDSLPGSVRVMNTV